MLVGVDSVQDKAGKINGWLLFLMLVTKMIRSFITVAWIISYNIRQYAHLNFYTFALIGEYYYVSWLLEMASYSKYRHFLNLTPARRARKNIA